MTGTSRSRYTGRLRRFPRAIMRCYCGSLLRSTPMTHVRPSIADKRRAFHKLHEAGCFVIPNPWDVGSARYLQGLKFKALATTSSGFAWSHGHRDGAMSRDRVLDHL